MHEQSLSIVSHSRSHQGLKVHRPDLNSGGFSILRGEVNHLNSASFWHAIETNRHQTPMVSELFTEILSAIFQHQEESQKVSELLAENLDWIHSLPNELRRWLSTKSDSNLTKDRKIALAWVLVDFGGLIWMSPHGQKAQNREVAIACCETALHLLQSQKFSQVWGQIHNNLALAYGERSIGDRSKNLLQAFTHYQTAAEVVGRQPFPKHWNTIKT